MEVMARIQKLGLVIARAAREQLSEVVLGDGCEGVVGTEGLLLDGQGLLEVLLRLHVALAVHRVC